MRAHTTTLAAVLRMVAAGTAAVLLAAFAHYTFMTVPVTIDGDRVAARAGTPVAQVAAECSPARPGDVLAVADRRIVGTGSGRPVIVLVNGKVAGDAEVVAWGDRVQAFSGTDVVESVLVETRTVEVPPTVIGIGPVERVLATGTAGVALVTVGRVSGDVVATETITPGRPRLVRRVPGPGARVVALTFDDGPWPGQTDAVLDILDERE